MIEYERITTLNNKCVREEGEYVLYWMQASQRVEYNHALAYAIEKANERSKPVLVVFGLMGDYPEANARHFHFMLEGLNEVREQLLERGIGFVVRVGTPWKAALELSEDAAIVVADRGYLSHQRKWRKSLAGQCACQAIEVESDVVVPIETVSNKREYSAATIRKKIHKHLDRFLKQVRLPKVKVRFKDGEFESVDISDVGKVVESLGVDGSVSVLEDFCGGTSKAKKRLIHFKRNLLQYYSDKRNDPVENCQSELSPYLHFGQISPLYAAREVLKSDKDGVDDFIEQLVVRRELSMNFVWFCEWYDRFECLPGWAKSTLREHKSDKRVYIYRLDDLENARTHDPYWNAAQLEMVHCGKMHGYMRMYWGKKIVEWSKSPEDAFKRALYLNNKYELDGRDPNGYTGVAWCFGNHDRPWSEREVFGNIRYMNDSGLKRKFRIDDYVSRVSKICSSKE